MCNCRNEVNLKLSEMLKVKGEIVNYEMISGKTYSTFNYKVGNRNKEQLVLHSYCPICGKKYDGE